MRRSMVMRSRATDGRSASECQGNGQIRSSNAIRDAWNAGSRSPPRVWASRQSRKSLPFKPARGSSGESRFMRVLTIIYNLKAGGTQRAAQNFSIAYRKNGIDVAVLAIEEGGPRQQELEKYDIPVFIGDSDLQERLREVDAWGPDIIHIHRWGGADRKTGEILKFLKKDRVRVLETNVFSLADNSEDQHLIDVHLHLSQWCLWRWNQLLKLSGSPQIGCVLPNLVDCDPFYPIPRTQTDAVRAGQGIPEDAFVFGRIGQPLIGKWSHIIIDAFEQVAKKHAKAYLVLIGATEEVLNRVGRLDPELSRRVKSLPQVFGDEKLREAYDAFDVFLHSAQIGESFGMVLAEAMLCGVPVITESTPFADNSQLEVVRHGEGGLVVCDRESMVAAMEELMENESLRRTMSSKGPVLIRSRFSGEALIPPLLRIIRHVQAASNRNHLRQLLEADEMLTTHVSGNTVRKLMDRSYGKTSARSKIFVRFPRAYRFLRALKVKLRA
jgi:glycosyltransferase involved in cell wall biosynthesis